MLAPAFVPSLPSDAEGVSVGTPCTYYELTNAYPFSRDMAANPYIPRSNALYVPIWLQCACRFAGLAQAIIYNLSLYLSDDVRPSTS